MYATILVGFAVLFAVETVNITNCNDKTKRTLSQYFVNYEGTKPVLTYPKADSPHIIFRNNLGDLKSKNRFAIQNVVSEIMNKHPYGLAQQNGLLYNIPNLNGNGRTSLRNQLHQSIISSDIYPHLNKEPLSKILKNQNILPSILIEYKQPNTAFSDAKYSPITPQKHVYRNGQDYRLYSLYPSYHSSKAHMQRFPVYPNLYHSHLREIQNTPINYVNNEHRGTHRKLVFNGSKYITPTQTIFSKNNMHNENLKTNQNYSLNRPLKQNEYKIKAKDRKPIKNEQNQDGEKTNSNQIAQVEDYNISKHPYNEESDHYDYLNEKEVSEEENEDDNKRESTSRITLTEIHKNQSEYNQISDNKFPSEGYNVQHSDHGPLKKINGEPQLLFESFPAYKNPSEVGAKLVDSKQSKIIPVISKHKLFKEKWYISNKHVI